MNAIGTLSLSPEGDLVSEVMGQTKRSVRSFLDELTNRTTSFVSVHNLTEQIEHQYVGRFALELIQNGHDAIAADRQRGSGRILLKLFRDEGPHGTLYAANDGRPFRRKDFEAITNLAQSAKDPNDSIGNKGIGFRSVLQVCATPEIYSRGDKSGAAFDGYCFRFDPKLLVALRPAVARLAAGGSDVTWTFAGRTFAVPYERADEFRASCAILGRDPLDDLQYLSPYQLPVPAPGSPLLPALADAGYSTVIRLQLSSREALAEVERALGAIDEEPLLFLPSVTALTIDLGGNARSFARREVRRGRRFLVSLEEGDESPARRCWLWRRRFGDTGEEAIRLQAATAKLPKAWRQLRSVTVEIAVNRSPTARGGRYFTYLPTEESSGIAASFNAPFFAGMDRRAVRFEEALNGLLMEQLAALGLEALDDLSGAGDDEAAAAAVDLLAPLGDPLAHQRWFTKLVAGGLLSRKVVKTDAGWRPLGKFRILETVPSPRYFNLEVLRGVAGFECVVAALESRQSQLRALLESLQLSVRPTAEELAEAVERAAEALSHQPSANWTGFWEDVRQLLPDPKVLAHRRVAIDSVGQLRAPGDVEEEGVPRLFFPSGGAADGDGEAPEVPATLRHHIAFLSDRVPLTVQAGSTRVYTAIFRYLEPVVAKYDRHEIIAKFLLPALPEQGGGLEPGEQRFCAEILDWTLSLFETARSRDTLRPLLRSVRLPCIGGWLLASEALVGPGWGGRGDRLEGLLKRIDTPVARLARGRMLLPPGDPAWHGTSAKVTRLLADLPVFDGLRPQPASDWTSQFVASSVGPPILLSTPPPDLPANVWHAYTREVGPQLTGESQRGKRYRFVGATVMSLPGLDRLEQLAPDDRKLYADILIDSISRWPEAWKTATIERVDLVRSKILDPSPLAFALQRLKWLWLEQDGGVACAPGECWLLPGMSVRERPYYEHLRPLSPSIVGLAANPETRKALLSLGVREAVDDVPTSSPALLQALANAWKEGRVKPQHAEAFRNQVEKAWQDFYPGEPAALPTRFVVVVGRELRTAEAGKDMFFLPMLGYRFPEHGPYGSVPVLVIRPTDANELSDLLVKRLGGAVAPLASLKLEVWSGSALWNVAEAPLLANSEFAWLVKLTLAMARHAGDRGGVVGGVSFRSWVTALTKARFAMVPALAIRVTGADVAGERHTEDAVWLPGASALVFNPNASLESLADPLQQILGRADFGVAMGYALRQLDESGSRQDISNARLVSALGPLRITEEQLGAIEREIGDDIEWLSRRLAPLVHLEAGAKAVARTNEARSEDALRAALGSLEVPATPDQLVELARGACSSWEMGRELQARFGDRYSMPRWNEALQALGEERVTNRLAAVQWRRHIEDTRTLMRCVLRSVAATGAAYAAAQAAVDAVLPPEDLAERSWEVPFTAPMVALAGVVSLHGATADLVQALTGKHSKADLERALEECGVDLQADPVERLADNEARCRKLFRPTSKVALALSVQRGFQSAELARSCASPDVVLERLRLGRGPLELMTDAQLASEILETVLPRVLRELADRSREAGGLEALIRETGLRAEELEAADQAIEGARLQQAREATPVLVICGMRFKVEEASYGDLWSHLSANAEKTAAADFDLKGLSRLEAVDPVRERRNGAGGSGRGGGTERRLSEPERNLIGFAGEVYAYNWLLRKYGPTVVTPSAWVSKLSLHRFEPRANVDDGLGYDLKISLPGDTREVEHLIEVKASKGDDEAFDLGSSEVEKAIEVADRRWVQYTVIHILRVFDATPIVRILPNPFSRKARGLFQPEGAGQRFRYAISGAG